MISWKDFNFCTLLQDLSIIKIIKFVFATPSKCPLRRMWEVAIMKKSQAFNNWIVLFREVEMIGPWSAKICSMHSPLWDSAWVTTFFNLYIPRPFLHILLLLTIYLPFSLSLSPSSSLQLSIYLFIYLSLFVLLSIYTL